MTRREEFRIKAEKIQSFLEKTGADGIVFSRSDTFAWATCGGADYINIAQDCGVASIIFTDGRAILLTNNIESGRLGDEELDDLPVETVVIPWHADKEKFALREIIGSKKFVTDSEFAGLPLADGKYAELMFDFTESELERYREVGKLTGEALQEACRMIRPGMSEYQVAGLLAKSCHDRCVVPTVNLIASDERILKYRHPLPAPGKSFEKTIEVVVCGRRWGLIASCTRIVNVGNPGDDLRKRHDACAYVDAVMNTSTRPGKSVGEVFRAGQKAYADKGYEGEWQLHHQGGPAGYRGRYFLGSENCDAPVLLNSGYAWNPSITGTKTEDTILILENGNEFITSVAGWPMLEVEANGITVARPDILTI